MSSSTWWNEEVDILSASLLPNELTVLGDKIEVTLCLRGDVRCHLRLLAEPASLSPPSANLTVSKIVSDRKLPHVAGEEDIRYVSELEPSALLAFQTAIVVRSPEWEDVPAGSGQLLTWIGVVQDVWRNMSGESSFLSGCSFLVPPPKQPSLTSGSDGFEGGGSAPGGSHGASHGATSHQSHHAHSKASTDGSELIDKILGIPPSKEGKKQKKKKGSKRTAPPPSEEGGDDPLPNRMRPSWDVIARLRWDSSLAPETWLIGYEDRFVGIQEVDLKGWDQGYEGQDGVSSFPMHRIRYFKRDGKVVWDRRPDGPDGMFDHVFADDSSSESSGD